MLEPDVLASLTARLDASRAGLLAALEGVTERDFGVDLGGGETVVQALAALAAAEQRESASTLGEASEAPARSRPLAPQVVHALAGARYRTRRYLEGPALDAVAAEALVGALVAREASTAERIRGRPRAEPPPVIPMVDHGNP